MMMTRFVRGSFPIMALAAVAGLAACGGGHESPAPQSAPVPAGDVYEVVLGPRPAVQRVSAVARPIREATLGTKLMGAVTEVLVHEGDVVRAGQPLVRIDARDIAAKGAQVEASLAAAEAGYRQAELHADRTRALFADDAAPKAQLDAAESGLEQARAGVAAARAAAAELGTLRAYSTVAAPFGGTLTARMVDPGSFVAPGTPLLVVQDAGRLRVTATAAAESVRGLARGVEVLAIIENEAVPARIEGVVPARTGGLFTVNAIVENAAGLYAPGAASLDLPLGMREMVVVPVRAIVRQSDLTGVYLKRGDDALLRWVRVGAVRGDSVEVLGGLTHGDRIIVPAAAVVR